MWTARKHGCPDDLLVKADKITLATSVELRVPLLDHQVLEFAASLPPDFKVQRQRKRKRIFKAALSPRNCPPKSLIAKKLGSRCLTKCGCAVI